MLLLDTHVAVWVSLDDPKLGAAARTAVVQAFVDGQLAISTISFWEAAMLVEKGRIHLPEDVEQWRRELLSHGVIEIPVDGVTAARAGRLPDIHGDPADRIIMATARNGHTLITSDRQHPQLARPTRTPERPTLTTPKEERMLSQADNEALCRIGPGTLMGAFFREYWLPALQSWEVPEPDSPPVRIKLLGEELVAFRDTTGVVGLVDNYCPHRRASLFFGRNEESGIRCVYHGWKFDTNGDCVDMPSEPAESNFRDKVKIKAYPTHERNGVILGLHGPPR